MWKTEGARKYSDNRAMPVRTSAVTFVRITPDGKVTADHCLTGPTGKRAMLDALMPGDLLMAAWTGQYRTDMFVIDDVKEVRDKVK